MLCQNCGKNEATTHIKRIANGERVSLHLCHSCAAHLGYTDLFSGTGFNLSSFLQEFFPSAVLPEAEPKEEERCPTCGCTFSEIVRTGMMGCADCYSVFYEKLRPSLNRIHGRASHIGKKAASVDRSVDLTEQILSWQKEMDEAVKIQNFERAAELRDKINALKGGSQT